MNNKKLFPYLELFIGLFFISSSGPLGRFIDCPPEISIWSRCFIAGLFMLIVNKLTGITYQIYLRKHWKTFLISSVFIATHWVTYFYSLQYSSVAIGMLTLFTFPVITSFLEPLYFRTKFNLHQIFLGILVIFGLYFLLPEGEYPPSLVIGIGFGLVSALVFSIRNIMVKSLSYHYSGQLIMTIQILISLVILTPFLFTLPTSGIVHFWPYLLILGIITTAVGHTLFARAFSIFSATTTSIFGGLQPVCGILLGALFLSEIPSSRTILGGLIILSTVFIEVYLVLKKSPSLNNIKTTK